MIEIRKPNESEFRHWVRKSNAAQIDDVSFDASFDGAALETVLLAYEGSSPVAGIVFMQAPCAIVTIDLLYTMPDYRGRGIGSRLLDTVYRWARQRGATQLALNAHPDAKSFYEQYGFCEHPDSEWVRMTKEIVRP